MTNIRAYGPRELRLSQLGPIVVLALVLVSWLIPAGFAQSQEAGRDRVTLEGSHNDVQFLAGRSVRIHADVSDDVFAAGRDVTFDSAAVRNAIVAGYDIEQRAGTIADMIAAGANVRIAGTVEDDLVALGRSLRVAPDGAIGSDARLAAETIDVEGRIGGSLRAAARRITIAGEIAGKADLFAERIVITSGANIGGDLIYRSETDVEIADDATIGGEVRRVEVEMPDLSTVGLAILGIGIAIAVSWTIAMLVLVVVIQLAFPYFSQDAAEQLRTRPWSSLGIGVACIIVASALAGVLLVSILGIPLGAALIMAIAIVLLLGLVTVSYCIGLFIRERLRGPGDIGAGGRVGWALLGAVIIALVGLIPFVGSIVAGLAVAAGFGAAAGELWMRLHAA